MAAVSPSEFRLIRVCGAALLVSCFVFLFTYETGVQYFLLDALLGLCGLFLLGWRKMQPLWLRARAGALYAENSRLVEACTVSVGEGGLRVERPQYRAGLPFEALAWAYEDRARFPLFPRGRHVLLSAETLPFGRGMRSDKKLPLFRAAEEIPSGGFPWMKKETKPAAL